MPIPVGDPAVLPDLLRARAALQPDRVAMIVGDRGPEITYRDWEERSNALARGLVTRGIAPGDRVALVFGEERWTDYLVAYAGTHKAGAIAVPVSGTYAQTQIGRVIEHCGASGLCAAGPVDSGEAVCWSATPDELEKSNAKAPLQVPVERSALAEILYTSGTTGLPRGVACSHADLLFGVVTHGPLLDAHRDSLVALHAFPIGSNAAQGLVRVGIHRLARAVVMPSFEPEGFAALVARQRPAMVSLVPAMAFMLLEWGTLTRHDFSSVTHFGLTGAPSPPSLLRRLAEALPLARIENYYGLTEAGIAGTTMVYDPKRAASVGRPNGGCEVHVVNEDGDTCAVGEVGDVWIGRQGAPQRCYYGEPEETALVFRDGWTRTADLGYLDDEGYLFLVDRRADSIISGGYNVSCIEVENVLYEHPAVAEAAVFGMPHPVLGQSVATAVVLRGPATKQQVIEFASERLAAHQLPGRVLFVGELPRSPAGKVLKRELHKLAEANRAAAAPVAPQTATEEVVASLWRALLGLATVGIHDDFVDVGGTSLAAAQVSGMLNELLGVEIPPVAVYAAQTIAHFSAHVDEIISTRPSRAVDPLDVSPASLPERLRRVVASVAAARREDRLLALVDHGRRLPALPAHPRRDLERVSECQVPYFVAAELTADRRVRLFFDVAREAPVSLGFAGLLWAGLDGATAAEVLATPRDFYKPMGLEEVVSPLRLRVLDATLAQVKGQVHRQLAVAGKPPPVARA